MKQQMGKRCIILLLCCLVLSGCNQKKNDEDSKKEAQSNSVSEIENTKAEQNKDAEPVEEAGVEGGKMVDEKIHSKCIEKNIVGDTANRKFYVYLPPSYETSDKSYPVVYFLHGYGDSSRIFVSRIKGQLDAAWEDASKEFIFVSLDGNNKAGGSFYENSPSSGDWEDFIFNEMVEYIDDKYRTLATAESRSITGYSMGGYGAINIALKHPDIFSSVMAFCPGICADEDFQAMWDSWEIFPDIKISYSQVFSPNTDSEKNFGNIPEFSGTEDDNKIIEQWKNGYGNWDSKIQNYIALDTPLKGIQINYSDTDQFTWIPNGCKDFSGILDSAGIEHQLNQFEGGHVVPDDVVENYYMPFFEKYLQYE